MKVLLLSVALLFFTGAQGRYFWQQDEPHQEPESDKTLQKLLHDGIAIITDIAKNLDVSEIAKEYQIKERMEGAKKHVQKLEKAIEAYYYAVFKKVDEQLREKFPTFKGKVLPALKEFDDALEKQLEKVFKELFPVGSDLVAGITKHAVAFFEGVEIIAENGRDKLRTEVDSLRVKLQPYVDDVHAEYENHHKELKDALEQDYQVIKQKVEKHVEAMREHAKPHIETLKSKIPDGKALQAKLEELLNKMKEAMKEEDK